MSKIKDFLIDDGRLTKYCGSDEEATIPHGVTSIGKWAFKNCGNLTSVFIPNSVTSIGEWAFYQCTSLTNVILSDEVTQIADYAFYGCKSLVRVIIPDGVMHIGHSAFSGCECLESVVIPDGVTHIGDHAFSGCKSLEGIFIPDSVLSIGWAAFSYCKRLKEIKLPAGLKSVSQELFQNCAAITDVSIPLGVTKIERKAFYQCGNLKRVVIPPTVKTIEEQSFRQCRKLTDVLMENGLKTIDRWAFYMCTGIKDIIIPETAEKIHAQAFEGCTNINIHTADAAISSSLAASTKKYSEITDLSAMKIRPDMRAFEKKRFLIDECYTETEKAVSAVIKQHSGVIQKAFSETTDYFVVDFRTMKKPSHTLSTAVSEAHKSFELTGKPNILVVSDIMTCQKAFVLSRFQSFCEEEKIAHGVQLYKKAYSELNAALSKSKTYNYPIVAAMSAFDDSDHRADDSALISQFVGRLSKEAGFANKMSKELIHAYISSLKGNKQSSKSCDIEGTIGFEIPLAVAVGYSALYSPLAEVSFTLARDKWEYRGDYNMGKQICWRISPVYAQGNVYRNSAPVYSNM